MAGQLKMTKICGDELSFSFVINQPSQHAGTDYGAVSEISTSDCSFTVIEYETKSRKAKPY